MNTQDLLLISVGNTRTRLATARGDQIEPARVLVNAEEASLHQAITEGLARCGEGARALLASVNDPVADRLSEVISGGGRGAKLIRLGRGLAVPIRQNLAPESGVGIDRLLNALGAYSRSGEACVVIDAGTAITVDLVDETGVFQGGVIAPGLAMMMKALHEGTAALPLVTPPTRPAESAGPLANPLGKDTIEAITKGCVASAVGLARLLIDRYAELGGRYPRVVATGGDAPLLFGDDELIEHVVPDLTLIGMHAAWMTAGRGAGASGGSGGAERAG